MTSKIATSAINGLPHNTADAVEQISPSQAVASIDRRSCTAGTVSVMIGRPSV